MSERAPVTDWLTDWDHLDPRWVEDPFPIWEDIRTSGCPIAHTDRFRGAYLPTRYDDIRAIAYDPEHFSSRQVIVRDNPPPVEGGGAPPITSDPPRHRAARMVLLPPFTPQAVDKLIPKARAVCNELIDAFIGKGRCDAAGDYAQHIPVRLIAHMLGIPDSDGDRFRKWIHDTLEVGTTDQYVLERGFAELTEYFRGHLQARREKPGDDLISYLLTAKYPDGQPFKENHILGSLRLLLVAGIDTTWSGIGASLWHLAKTPADRRRLAAEPGADAERHRGVPARLRARHHGAPRRQGDVAQRLHLQGGRDGDAPLPGGQPRSRRVPRRRQGDHRPQGEPARGLRPRHPPLRRLEPGAHGDDGGGRGVPEAHPRLRRWPAR